MASSPNWLQRYRAGQRDQVWAELRELGGAVRRPGPAQEAQLVCDEMARRARHNVGVIVERLAGQGYRFHANDDAQTPVVPWASPTVRAAQHAAWLQERKCPRWMASELRKRAQFSGTVSGDRCPRCPALSNSLSLCPLRSRGPIVTRAEKSAVTLVPFATTLIPQRASVTA